MPARRFRSSFERPVSTGSFSVTSRPRRGRQRRTRPRAAPQPPELHLGPSDPATAAGAGGREVRRGRPTARGARDGACRPLGSWRRCTPREDGRSNATSGRSRRWLSAGLVKSGAGSRSRAAVAPNRRRPGCRVVIPPPMDRGAGSSSPGAALTCRYRTDELRTQNSLPSGSASTTHPCGPWPMSTREAPRSKRRSTSLV